MSPQSARRFLESELEELPAGRCLFQIIPTPWEASVSYGGGTAAGPQAILDASSQLELWTGRGNPSLAGLHTWPAVDCRGPAENVLRRIEKATQKALASSRRSVPVLLGGEHSITLGALRALRKTHGRFGILHFDAHADLRQEYQGNVYSHACVMRRAVEDLDLALFQVGVRSLSEEEEVYRRRKNIHHLDARPYFMAGGLAGVSRPLLPADFPKQLFISFDIDALDCSLMPATGTPEPGGLGFWEALELVRLGLAGRVAIGFDVPELAPLPGLHAADYTAARLAYEIMGIILDNNGPNAS